MLGHGGDWQAFASGGGVTFVGGALGVLWRRHRHLGRLLDVLQGVPASQGVPAQPSIIDRLEKVSAELSATEARMTKIESDVHELNVDIGRVRYRQITAEDGHTKWAEGYDRRLRLLRSELRRAGVLPIGGGG